MRRLVHTALSHYYHMTTPPPSPSAALCGCGHMLSAALVLWPFVRSSEICKGATQEKMEAVSTSHDDSHKSPYHSCSQQERVSSMHIETCRVPCVTLYTVCNIM